MKSFLPPPVTPSDEEPIAAGGRQLLERVWTIGSVSRLQAEGRRNRLKADTKRGATGIGMVFQTGSWCS